MYVKCKNKTLTVKAWPWSAVCESECVCDVCMCVFICDQVNVCVCVCRSMLCTIIWLVGGCTNTQTHAARAPIHSLWSRLVSWCQNTTIPSSLVNMKFNICPFAIQWVCAIFSSYTNITHMNNCKTKLTSI